MHYRVMTDIIDGENIVAKPSNLSVRGIAFVSRVLLQHRTSFKIKWHSGDRLWTNGPTF